MNDNMLMTIVKDSGLEKTKADFILEKFQDYFKIAGEWENKIKTIIVTSDDQKVEMEMARVGRLFLRDKRITIEKTRKELKEQSLREGKAIDGIANVLKALIEPIESYLDQQENFTKNRLIAEEKEKQRQEQIRLEKEAREKEEQRIRLEKEAREKEEQRIRLEKEEQRIRLEKEEQERIKAENERLRQEAIERERLAKIEREKHEKELAEIKAKEEEEKKERERLLEIERKKQEEILKLEREKSQREKLERERLAKKKK
ncbi:MAG: hypothetical protein WC389_03505, partial [Lutibacter sp.]